MPTLKKLTLAPFFLISLSLLMFLLKPHLGGFDVIFSLSSGTFINLLIFSALISLSSFLFVLFICLAQDWKIILPIGGFTLVLPPVIIDFQTGLILSIGLALSLLIIFLTLTKKLKSYLQFSPIALFNPSIKQMSALLILVLSLSYFLSIDKVVKLKGFEIPDEIIDQALKFTPNATGETSQPQVSISNEQLDLLKQNPDLLKQSGLDPKILDTLRQPAKSSSPPKDIVKDTVKSQFQIMIKPYLGVVPIVLAILFFFILQSLTSIINLLIYPLLWITFYILEKTKFISFTEEQRTVRKMVV